MTYPPTKPDQHRWQISAPVWRQIEQKALLDGTNPSAVVEHLLRGRRLHCPPTRQRPEGDYSRPRLTLPDNLAAKITKVAREYGVTGAALLTHNLEQRLEKR